MNQLGIIGTCAVFAFGCSAVVETPNPQTESARDTAGSTETVKAADDGCGGTPSRVTTVSGGTLAIAGTGTALRINAIYRGNAIGVEEVRAADRILSPSAEPLKAGFNSGYWAELQDAQGATLYTDSFYDPLVTEAHLVGGGGSVSKAPLCNEKNILIEVPMDPKARHLVFFGNGYEGPAAQELARFSMP